jgi:hypothetical protein
MAIKLKQTSPELWLNIFWQFAVSIIDFSKSGFNIVPDNIDLHSKTVVGLPSSCNKTPHFTRIWIELCHPN